MRQTCCIVCRVQSYGKSSIPGIPQIYHSAYHDCGIFMLSLSFVQRYNILYAHLGYTLRMLRIYLTIAQDIPFEE